ncbi:MAG: HYC_CC_PP family protein [Bacteroidota bacterium]
MFLFFIFFASHMYLTMGTHFCGGEAIETKIIVGETHLGCGTPVMEALFDHCQNADTYRKNFDKFSCCHNEYQTVHTTNEFLKEAAQITFTVEFAVTCIYTTWNQD